MSKNVIEKIYLSHDHFLIQKNTKYIMYQTSEASVFCFYNAVCSHMIAIAVIEILYLFFTTMDGDAHEKSAKHEDLIAGDKI